jgi:hypothetical protein
MSRTIERRFGLSTRRRGLGLMSAGLLLLVAALPMSSSAASPWLSAVTATNQVASTPFRAGGYPVPDGATAPLPGTCRLGSYNANRSESWLAVKPGTEDLVGTSKVFFEKYSTFYDFHLGSYTIPNGTPGGNAMVTGYECVSTGTQAMPPSWTNDTDPNVDFDTQGRAYQVTLPFNAYWTNLHPNGAIGAVYSDDLGKSWTVANGGKYLEFLSNQSSYAFGGYEDKQWVAVNHVVGSQFQDHVYAMWSVFNGNTTKIKVAVSRDRGATFSTPTVITAPQATGPSNTYIYPSVDAAGDVYIGFSSFPASSYSPVSLFVSRSIDDAKTFGPFTRVATTEAITTCCLPNTTFRDGIINSFAASPTYAGHLYVAWESWDGTQMDVKFSQSTNGGTSWSTPVVVNDNLDAAGVTTDQFQPSIAAGANGAVAIAFYDRRVACPSDSGILPADVGRTNFCIDVSLQPFKDSGAGAVAVGSNIRVSNDTWDPEQPGQTIDGLDQMACAAHTNPCTERAFIGDYFGLAISGGNIYTLSVSTHYPSSVRGDFGKRVYYQQQVLGTVSRAAIGSGY